MLVPDTASLLLAVHVLFDFKDVVVWVSASQGDVLKNVHDHLLFLRGLWVSKDEVELRCVPIVHGGKYEDQADGQL